MLSSLVKKGDTTQPPIRVLELKVQVPTRWSSLCYIIERCGAIAWEYGIRLMWDVLVYLVLHRFVNGPILLLRLSEICGHALMNTHGSMLSTYKTLSYQIGMH